MSLPEAAGHAPDQADLANPQTFADDGFHAIFRHLREHDPVHWNHQGSEPGFWSVTRHADCVRVLKDPGTFSSAATNVLGPHRWDTDQGSGRMLNATDPPRHTELRRLIGRHFTPRAVAGLEPYLRSVAAASLDEAAGAGECDFVDVVALLPVASIAALLGVPREDWEILLRLTTSAFGSSDRDYQTSASARATSRQAHARLLLYCRDLLRQRQRQPRDDIVTLLATARGDGRLSGEEAMMFFDLLMLGGNETTRHGAVGALLALMDFPAQWRRLRDNRQLLPGAVAETLRWTSPSRHVLRRAKRPVILRGRQIGAGQDVVIWHVSANRDERVFAQGDVFNMDRSPNPHLGLGAGPHFCLGASLATLELTVFLDELMSRIAAAELLEPPSWLASTVISGVKHLNVRLHPR